MDHPSMRGFDVATFANSAALAETAAGDWLAQAGEPQGELTPRFIALAGGRIAGRFLAAAAARARTLGFKFPSTHFFWGDERCVGPDDPESNFALARRHFLAPLMIPEPQVHRIRGELPPSQAAGEAEAELRRFAPVGQVGLPLLDLVFLGMGEDGHVASLFPGEAEEVMSSPAVYRAVIASKPPPRRVTLGYPVLCAARQVWVLISGAGKEQILRESLSSTGRAPLARLLRLRPQTRLLVSRD